MGLEDWAEFSCGGTVCWAATVGSGAPAALVVMPADEDGRGQLARITALLPGAERLACFVLAGFSCRDWNYGLSPWAAPALGAKQPPFGGGGAETLAWLTGELLPELEKRFPAVAGKPKALLGYSLAGLFALWALYQNTGFSACAACSPSLWFDGWGAYQQTASAPPGSRLYLSLGQREPKARNPRMAAVGEAAQQTYNFIKQDEHVADHTFVWQPGGHFQDVDKRLAQGLGWLVAP